MAFLAVSLHKNVDAQLWLPRWTLDLNFVGQSTVLCRRVVSLDKLFVVSLHSSKY